MRFHIPSALYGACMLFLGLSFCGYVVMGHEKRMCRADNPGLNCIYVPGYFAPAKTAVQLEGR